MIMNENNFNWDRFTHSIFINAEPEKIFEYLATPSGITKWFIGESKYYYKNLHIRLGNEIVKKGDSFLWKWLNKDLELKGMVTESSEDNSFEFTFSPLYLVTLKLSKSGERTKLSLTQQYQESAAKDEFNYLNCCVCWVFFLTNLKSVIENGIDLRERKENDEMLVNL